MVGMDDVTRTGYLAHAMLPIYKRRIEQAREWTREALELCQNPYVAFSGGKDSAVMLHIVATERPGVDAQILMGGETRLLHPDIDDVLKWWKSNTSVNLIEVLVDTVFADGWEDATFEESYSQFYDGWNKYLHDKGHDGVFIGLRKSEAGNRRRLFRRFGAIHRYSENRKDARAGIVLACPLSNLTTADVWAYLIRHDIPTFDAYVDGDERTKTRLGWRAMNEFGQLADLRTRNPRGFNEIVARFPELRRFGG